ncbi:hypothetical protein ES695_13235 [Candidatus Atribacteria bacterium 1244-E10-H5-B2]|nr:MAG: hypothetical protein ES695_13235 [Candidatus Atribacteria bacterium 1244-E10-H5-B2]
MRKMNNFKGTVGILLTGSDTPKILGDPANPETFEFPVITEKLKGLSVADLLHKCSQTAEKILKGAKELEKKGASFIVGDCGLFALYQKEISSFLEIPFLSSSLVFVPFLEKVCGGKIGILAGDSRLETEDFFTSIGLDNKKIRVCGMEKAIEFNAVVLEGSKQMDINKMKMDVTNLVKDFVNTNKDVSCLVLECTNLIPFASYVQEKVFLPVFDAVLLTNMFYKALHREDFRKIKKGGGEL